MLQAKPAAPRRDHNKRGGSRDISARSPDRASRAAAANPAAALELARLDGATSSFPRFQPMLKILRIYS
jgi:hypothetical protein